MVKGVSDATLSIKQVVAKLGSICRIAISLFNFFSKTPKTVLLISQQPNIAQRLFCIQNKWQDITFYKDHCCRFFTS